jgi:hypothetical protein
MPRALNPPLLTKPETSFEMIAKVPIEKFDTREASRRGEAAGSGVSAPRRNRT